MAIFLMTSVSQGQPIATSPDQLMQVPAFAHLMATVGQLNEAMRVAALNPMDKWRQRNVRTMMGQLPGAIRGLAGVFASNQLVDTQLPMVMSMLGGFVDTHAADLFKQFLKNPSSSSIPQMGQTASGSAMLGGGNSSGSGPGGPSDLVMNSNPTTAATTQANGSLPPSQTTTLGALAGLSLAPSPQTAGLQSVPGSIPASQASSQISTPGNASNAPASGASNATSGAAVNAASSETPTSASNLSSGVGDILSPATPTGAAGAAAQPFQSQVNAGSSLTGNFTGSVTGSLASARFPTTSRGAVRSDKASSRSKKRTLPPPLLPQRQHTGGKNEGTPLAQRIECWFAHNPILTWMLFLPENAFAEDGGGSDSSGGQAAAILLGLAGIIGAAVPAVSAAIQASADVQIAQIQTAGQETMTAMAANTSQVLAATQANVAAYESGITQQMNAFNQNQQSSRLGMQLAELRDARYQNLGLQEQNLQTQFYYNQQKIGLTQQQVLNSISLGKETLNAQMAQAGLSSGTSGNLNSGGSVGINRVLSGARSTSYANPALAQAGNPGQFGGISAGRVLGGGTGLIASLPLNGSPVAQGQGGSLPAKAASNILATNQGKATPTPNLPANLLAKATEASSLNASSFSSLLSSPLGTSSRALVASGTPSGLSNTGLMPVGAQNLSHSGSLATGSSLVGGSVFRL